MPETKTLGAIRTGAQFDPEKNTTADQIRNKAAELIDLLETLRYPGALEEATSSEKQRLISIASTKIETASMYGVKAHFTE
jgi:hypothetical protein